MKKCFVPNCLNTSENSKKLFLFVPRRPDIRKLWFDAVGLKCTKTIRHCCEDHFNLKTDSVDYQFYKRTKKNPTLKKLSIVPYLHITTSKLISSDEESNESIEPCDKTLVQDEPSVAMSLQSSTSSSSLPLDTSYEVEETYSSSHSSPPSSSSDLKELSAKREIIAINMHPRFYLGLTNDVYFLVKLISAKVNIIERDILIIFKKIRLNDAFFRLGIDFGLSKSQINKIFCKSLPIVESVMKPFVFWPSRYQILKCLPIPFRFKYSKVVSIIDCFEISIEKPANPVHQSMTWSDYKNANTIKYLVSSTPNGFINFISEGFGGRASDLIITENCGYLNVLPNFCEVLADRGFKNLAPLLAQKNVTLIRPASIINKEQLTTAQVKESQSIAALRIHIERIISRIREFALLGPHSQVDIHFLRNLNACVNIAAGIINLQPALIKS